MIPARSAADSFGRNIEISTVPVGVEMQIAGGCPGARGSVVCVRVGRITPAVPASICKTLDILNQSRCETHLCAGIRKVKDGRNRVLGIVLIVVDTVVLIENPIHVAFGMAKRYCLVGGFIP